MNRIISGYICCPTQKTLTLLKAKKNKSPPRVKGKSNLKLWISNKTTCIALVVWIKVYCHI